LVYADYDSQEQTFIDEIKHLLPGKLITFDLNKKALSKPIFWWKPSLITRNTHLSFNAAAEAVRDLFLTNIKLHLRSDVSLGAALSGGIDSSAVVCAMRQIEPDAPIHTFSFIADKSSLSEEIWIDQINQHVHATSHKIFATGQDLANDLDDMICAQGEPFGSTSIYAQYRVFKSAKDNGITVTLDGQGADELLAGYQGYPTQRISSLLEQQKFLQVIQFINQWQRWPNRGYKKGLLHLAQSLLPNDLHYLANRLRGIKSLPDWFNKEYLQNYAINTKLNPFEKNDAFKGNRVIEMLSACLQQKGLPELLRHGDRNSMRFSIESRVPFLTIPMADLVLSLPEHYLISNTGETKSVFREAMRGLVPDAVLNRRDKIGFATPEKDWLFSMAPTIRSWLEDSKNIPFLQSNILLHHFDAIISGKKPFSWQLWRLINFTRWYRHIIQGY
jgi:asparagine synthase (glutamine-hydrolysing)